MWNPISLSSSISHYKECFSSNISLKRSIDFSLTIVRICCSNYKDQKTIPALSLAWVMLRWEICNCKFLICARAHQIWVLPRRDDNMHKFPRWAKGIHPLHLLGYWTRTGALTLCDEELEARQMSHSLA